MTRRWIAVAGLLVLAALSVLVAPTSQAQVLPPLPALPAPPAEGNLLADVLGPASATVCDAAAVAYGLLGPIATAQLPVELRALVAEADPYVALVTYACGFLVTPPSGAICAIDQQVGQQTGLLGLPVGLPAAAQVLYDTAAGIERGLLRLGFDIGRDASLQVATALGCGEAPPEDDSAETPLQLPEPAPVAPPIVEPTAAGGFSSSALPPIPAIAARPSTEGGTALLPGTAGRLGAIRYPVRGQAAVLLALPCVLLAGVVAVGPRFTRRRRPERTGPAPWEVGS